MAPLHPSSSWALSYLHPTPCRELSKGQAISHPRLGSAHPLSIRSGQPAPPLQDLMLTWTPTPQSLLPFCPLSPRPAHLLAAAAPWC